MQDEQNFDDLFSCMMGALTEEEAPGMEEQANESTEDNFDSQNLIEEVMQSIQVMYQQSEQALSDISFAWMCGEALRKLLGFISRQKDAPKAFRKVCERLRAKLANEELSDALLANFIHLADAFPDVRDVERLSDKISLDSLLYIARLKDDMQRIYYSERAWSENWSANRLRKAVRENEYGKEFN